MLILTERPEEITCPKSMSTGNLKACLGKKCGAFRLIHIDNLIPFQKYGRCGLIKGNLNYIEYLRQDYPLDFKLVYESKDPEIAYLLHGPPLRND